MDRRNGAVCVSAGGKSEGQGWSSLAGGEGPSVRCPLPRPEATVGRHDIMIPTPPQPRYAPETRVRVTQHVRVGHRSWTTQVEGAVELEGLRPVGGMEMGGKSSYCQQPTLRLRLDNGEVTVVAVDENTHIQPLAAAPVDATAGSGLGE